MNLHDLALYKAKYGGGGGSDITVEPLSVTENGTTTAPSGKAYSPVTVNVEAPEPVLESLTVTENGEYTPGLGVDGFSRVSVNVQSGDSKENEIIEKTISGAYFNASISNIGAYAFAYCDNLETVEFQNCKHVYEYAFNACQLLSTIVMPNLEGLQQNAFQSVYSVKTISIPQCERMGNSAFCNCYNLGSISLPKISIIASNAFTKCRSLLSVYLFGTSFVSLANSNAFSSTPIAGYTTSTGGVYGSIYVRASMLESYKTRGSWSYFSNRFVGLTDEEIEELDNAN